MQIDPEVKREIESVTASSESEGVQVGSIEDLYSSIHPPGKKRRSATGKKRLNVNWRNLISMMRVRLSFLSR